MGKEFLTKLPYNRILATSSQGGQVSMAATSNLNKCQGGSDIKGSGGFSLHSISIILTKIGLGRLRTRSKEET